jgi:hypothetical protein
LFVKRNESKLIFYKWEKKLIIGKNNFE